MAAKVQGIALRSEPYRSVYILAEAYALSHRMTHEPWKRNCPPPTGSRIPPRLSQFERAHSWKLTSARPLGRCRCAFRVLLPLCFVIETSSNYTGVTSRSVEEILLQCITTVWLRNRGKRETRRTRRFTRHTWPPCVLARRELLLPRDRKTASSTD